jgi:ribosomal-protein-serine acetyltransferase
MQKYKKLIAGDRIQLRWLDATFDNAKMHNGWVCENIEHLKEYEDYNDMQSPENSYDFLNSGKRSEKRQQWGIFLQDEFIGVINIDLYKEKDKQCELGYAIAKKYSGNGYMTEAIRILCDELFALDVIRIEIQCVAENIASNRVAEKAGFSFIGTKHKSWFFNGKFVDENFYEKLKE